VLRELCAEIEVVSLRVGLMGGYDRFMRIIHESPQLRSRLWSLQQEIHDHLEATLREERAAAPDDRLPGLVAGQFCWIHSTVFVTIGQRR
jgi:hypothetical protein